MQQSLAIFIKKYLEEFERGSTRNTKGRTVTEMDIVIHAGRPGDFFQRHIKTGATSLTESWAVPEVVSNYQLMPGRIMQWLMKDVPG